MEVVGPEGREVLGEYLAPRFLARGPGARVLVFDGKPQPIADHPFSKGPGSLVVPWAEVFFDEPKLLRSLPIEESSFHFRGPDCLTRPWVSPDGNWAACALAAPSAPDAGAAPLSLWVFELVPESGKGG